MLCEFSILWNLVLSERILSFWLINWYLILRVIYWWLLGYSCQWHRSVIRIALINDVVISLKCITMQLIFTAWELNHKILSFRWNGLIKHNGAHLLKVFVYFRLRLINSPLLELFLQFVLVKFDNCLELLVLLPQLLNIDNLVIYLIPEEFCLLLSAIPHLF